jgi:hypothetical protein
MTSLSPSAGRADNSVMRRLFGDNAATDDARTDEELLSIPPEEAQAESTASIIERLEKARAEGVDPRTIFKQEKSVFGLGPPQDVFSVEVEKLFSPKVREFVRDYYGPAEMQWSPEGDMLGNLWRSVFGSGLTEEERKQVAIAKTLHERGSGEAAVKHKQTIQELLQGAPSPAELMGKIPPDTKEALPPWLRGYAAEPRIVRTSAAKETVLARDYGIKRQSNLDKKTVARAREIGSYANQIEGMTPGIAQKVVAPLLAEDFNKRFKLIGEDEVTAEALDLKQTFFQGEKMLTFVHPVHKSRVALDPLTLDWADVGEIIPELMVLGGDVAGSLIGMGGGFWAAGPGGAVGGQIIGGAIGAFVGRIGADLQALDKLGFSPDPELGGWTRKGFTDEKTGELKVVTWMDLAFDAKDDALWSLGGNVVTRLAYKGFKALLTRGAPTIAGKLTPDQFDRAMKNWQESRLGKKMTEAGEAGTLSTRLEQEADRLLKEADNVTGSEAQALIDESLVYREQAGILRKLEQGAGAEADRIRAREGLSREAMVKGEVTPSQVRGASSEDVGTALETAIPTTIRKEMQERVDDIIGRNNQAIKELDEILDETVVNKNAAGILGEAIGRKARDIMGDPGGDTGIYGVFNAIAKVTKSGFKGIPLKAFDLSEAAALLNKRMPRSGAILGAYPQDFLKGWNRIIATLAPGLKKDATEVGKTTVNYGNIKDLAISIRELLAENLPVNQRANLSEFLEVITKIQRRGLQEIDSAFVANNRPSPNLLAKQVAADEQFSTLAKIWQRGFTKGLDDAEIGTVASRFFANTDPLLVGEILKTIRPGKKDLELMRNALLWTYKQAIRKGQLDQGETAVEIAGRRAVVGLEKRATAGMPTTVTPASVVKDQTFRDENEAWIKVLFKKGEFDRLAEIQNRVGTQQRELKRLVKVDEDIRSNFAGLGEQITINENLGEVVVKSAQNLMDVVFQMPAGAKEKAIEGILKAIKGLPVHDQALAEANIRALAFRRIFRPEDAGIAKSIDAPPLDAFQIGKEGIEELKLNKELYDHIFGKDHSKDLLRIFGDIELLAREGSVLDASIGEILKGVKGGPGITKRVPLAALKIYVGVLNRRARALTQAQRIEADDAAFKFQNVLRDPDLAARLVAMAHTNLSTKFGLNALGNLLGLSYAESQRLVADFGTITPTEAALGK